MNSRPIDIIALILVVIGAINWGLIGFLRFDLVTELLGGTYSVVSRILYALIGVAGLYAITFFGRIRREI